MLSARRLGHAEAAERLERTARKRASEIAVSARDDARRQFEAASRDGYRDGLERALATWVPRLAELLADEAQLKARTRQALERYLSAVLTDAGVEAALVARCCDTAAAADDAGPDTWTLYVPDDRGELLAWLAESAPTLLHVRRGEAPWPVLERGDVVIEIDPGRPGERRLGDLLDAEALDAGLRQRAQAYAAEALNALQERGPRRRFQRDDTGETA